MKPPMQIEPVCCANHTHRYLPKPETAEEQAAVAAAEKRWDDEFYLVDPDDPEDGRSSTAELPEYVRRLVQAAGPSLAQ